MGTDRSNGAEATHVTDGQVSADTLVITDEALISMNIFVQHRRDCEMRKSVD